MLLLSATVRHKSLPTLDEGSIWLQVQLPSDISLEKGKEVAGELRRAVRSFPETSYVVTQLGRNDDGTDPFTPSHIEASIGLHPYDTWPSGETKAELTRRIDAKFRTMPGFSVGFSQPMIGGENIDQLYVGDRRYDIAMCFPAAVTRVKKAGRGALPPNVRHPTA